jgi:thymidylate synthase (FAD)
MNLNQEVKILDHGYVRLVEAYGHGDAGLFELGEWEAGIVEAARQSTQGSFRGWAIDQKLLATLYKNNHATPFEFAGMVLEIQAPIAVFREWHRHRTQSYNEMSARYAPMPNTHYMPDAELLVERAARAAEGRNTQEKGLKDAPALTHEAALNWLSHLDDLFIESERVYQAGLQVGIPKEVARGAVTVFRYTRMRACTNLRNWLAFLTLRMDPAAQWEIRQYANAVGEIVGQLFPRTYALFNAARNQS